MRFLNLKELWAIISEKILRNSTDDSVIKCIKCKIPMKNGIAIQNTVVGVPDFIGGNVITLSHGGPGKIIEVLKCPECGHSISK